MRMSTSLHALALEWTFAFGIDTEVEDGISTRVEDARKKDDRITYVRYVSALHYAVYTHCKHMAGTRQQQY